MRDALESLPWVEKGTVDADTTNSKATFVVKDQEQFDEKAVGKVIEEAGFELGQVLDGP